MNKIEKSGTAPQILKDKEKEEVCLIYNEYIKKNKPAKFKKDIYGADEVKAQLLTDQHHKCAYCERYLNGDYGAVEHFRPKGGYVPQKGVSLIQPGYYWLVYRWENLLYSCSQCNTSVKGNLFPITDENQRNIAHRSIAREQPLLLHPTTDEVGNSIEYHRFMLASKGPEGSLDRRKGEATINYMQLNSRNDLVERREAVWNSYTKHCLLLKIAQKTNDQELINLCESIISQLTSEENEFTGMFRYQKRE